MNRSQSEQAAGGVWYRTLASAGNGSNAPSCQSFSPNGLPPKTGHRGRRPRASRRRCRPRRAPERFEAGKVDGAGGTVGRFVEHRKQFEDISRCPLPRSPASPAYPRPSVSEGRGSSPGATACRSGLIVRRIRPDHVCVFGPPVEYLGKDLADAGEEVPTGVRIGGVEREEGSAPTVAKVLGEVGEAIEYAGVMGNLSRCCYSRARPRHGWRRLRRTRSGQSGRSSRWKSF
jgi:hypothetical protein